MSLITAGQVVASEIGDYILQSEWMAKEKTSKSIPCAFHALCYSIPFFWGDLVGPMSFNAWLFIVVTHFIIDRWRLARFVVYIKNLLAPPFRTKKHVEAKSVEPSTPARNTRSQTKGRNAVATSPHASPVQRLLDSGRQFQYYRWWSECNQTGYPNDQPKWMSVWLMIRVDNIMHVVLNGIALKYL